MIVIRPISDLRNRFSEIEKVVKEGIPVYLTKNGYGSMVVMSLEQYAALTENIETKLDEADRVAESSSERYRAEEIAQRVNKRIAKNEGV
jgi:prevent-host-death family protein